MQCSIENKLEPGAAWLDLENIMLSERRAFKFSDCYVWHNAVI